MVSDTASTHFDLFGLPADFAVDNSLLEARYRELQRRAHPDRFVNAGSQERRLSAQQAVRINEAYQTLKDPLLRGRYLLELSGYTFGDDPQTTSDAAFLSEQMELREALAGVRDSDDAFAMLGGILDRIADDLAALEQQLAGQLADGGEDFPKTAADTLVRMQFFRKLQEQAVELEVALEDELA